MDESADTVDFDVDCRRLSQPPSTWLPHGGVVESSHRRGVALGLTRVVPDKSLTLLSKKIFARPCTLALEVASLSRIWVTLTGPPCLPYVVPCLFSARPRGSAVSLPPAPPRGRRTRRNMQLATSDRPAPTFPFVGAPLPERLKSGFCEVHAQWQSRGFLLESARSVCISRRFGKFQIA